MALDGLLSCGTIWPAYSDQQQSSTHGHWQLPIRSTVASKARWAMHPDPAIQS